MMIKKPTRHGNSLAVVIDKPLCQLLSISEHTELKIELEGNRIIIAPATEQERNQRFRESLEKVNQKHGNALKRLAE